jgi:hypothetical protein
VNDEVATTQQNHRNADEQEDRHDQSPSIVLARQPFIAYEVPMKNGPQLGPTGSQSKKEPA